MTGLPEISFKLLMIELNWRRSTLSQVLLLLWQLLLAVGALLALAWNLDLVEFHLNIILLLLLLLLPPVYRLAMVMEMVVPWLLRWLIVILP